MIYLWSLVATLAALLVAALGWLVRVGRERRMYLDAFDSIPHPRQVVARDGTSLRSNSAFDAYFPGPSKAMPELLAGLVTREEFRDEIRRLDANAKANLAGHVEVEVAAPNGTGDERLWLDVQAQPLKSDPGAVLWQADDITARRQMQQTLADEQARFVDLLEHAPVGFYSVDQDGRLLFVNATLAQWLGTTPEALMAGDRRLKDIVRSGARELSAPYTPFHADSAGGETSPVNGEVEFLAHDGSVLEAFVAQELVPSEDGRLLTTRSVVRNLSEERAVVDALERSERRFRRFFEEAPVGIALLDPEGRISESNTAFCQMMKIDRNTVVGKTLASLAKEGDREAVQRVLSGDAKHLQIRGLNAPDTVCTVFATPLDEGDGGTGHIVHLIDTTEQRNLEEQFAQSQKMQAVGQLAGGIAHDFNNLLTAMIGFCDLLLLRHRPGDQSFADLMQIKQNANRAANLVRQLLAFSRQQTLRPTVLSVTDVLVELMHLLRRLIGERIDLDISHGRDLYPVKVDQGQLEQVIINLAVNARDAMVEEGGELAIRTSNVAVERELKREGETVPPGDYVLIEVADSGCGIAPENLDRIFEPFFSTKELGAGTGLGLSTVYGIVKQTGGFILVDSAPGVGTNFQIYLPRYAETGAEGVESDADLHRTKDLTGIGTLLLVEDEEAVRAFSARALRKKGYKVLEASSGEAALELLDTEEHIDLLITDVVMPQVDGPTLVRHVRERRPDLKVIFISGYTEDSFRQHLDKDARIRFLQKPFSLKQLAGIVKDVLYEKAA